MKKYIMVIPGTAAQIPLIMELKKRGYLIVCVNPEVTTKAFDFVDSPIKGDILDKEFCLSIAQKFEIVAIMSDQCDIAMPTVAYVSEKLNLRSIGVQMASLYTNKYLMREFCKAYGFAYPKYKYCESLSEAIAFFNNLDVKKMIIKPLDSNSSRGVFTIEKLEMIEEYYERAISFSKIDNAILCEEYIEGTEFTVDGIVLNKKHYSLAISKKKHYDYNPNIACELFFSPKDDEFDYEILKEINDKYVQKTGLKYAFTHAEYKYNGKEYILIEIGARGGGNYISSHIVPNVTNIDNYDLIINAIVNDSIEERDIKVEDSKYAVLKFFDTECDSGEVDKIVGEDFLEECDQIVLYEFRFTEGNIIKKATNDSARIGFYIAVANSEEKLKKVMNDIERNVKIIYKD